MTQSTPDTIELTPSYKLPLVLLVIGLSACFVQIWVGLAVSLFGIFLTIQTAILKLQFTPTALDVYRGETLLRHFPYAEWQNWEIFWSPVPILFYFKEVNSIHFLPIIFNPQTLQACLEQHFPKA